MQKPSLLKRIITGVLFLLSVFAMAQTDNQTSKIADFCRVWGFLKYYHPKVAKGNYDWDKEFTNRIKLLSPLNSKQEISAFYTRWLDELGEVKSCKKCKNEVPDSLKMNLDLRWLEDSTVFTPELMKRFQFIRLNRNQGRNYYVQAIPRVDNTDYKNEKAYKDSVFPTKELRLLGLSRFWNIIHYFYPYKYVIGEDWNSVLMEMIPKFRDAKDTVEYHLAMLELNVKINDSHGNFFTPYALRHFGFKWAPFKFKIIDNKAVVTNLYSDSLCHADDIRIGDVFISVNGRNVDELLPTNAKYVAGSNPSYKQDNYWCQIFSGKVDSFKAVYERDGIVKEKIVHRFLPYVFNSYWERGSKGIAYKILDGNIGYVNMEKLKFGKTGPILRKLKNTSAIIFDVRNYPDGTMYKIANFLNPEKKEFVKFTYPDLTYPGVYRYTGSYTCGHKNKNHYKGKVALLFNEETISHAEFTLMALKTAPDVIGIGSQTAGADGNVSYFKFPGAYEAIMTGIGVYYPDGTPTQRIGIVPDIEVKPTIAGIRAGKDEVLEKAIEVIKSR